MLTRRRALTVLTVAIGSTPLAAGPAMAHVTVHTDQPIRDASDAVVMFRTPNEEDHAATVKLQVFFPAATPLLDVLVEPHPGWTARTKVARLPHPVTTDDGTITSAVSEVTWTADTRADGLQPGQATDFDVITGELPDAPSAVFRALQTYSNGDVVKWIELQAPGADEPANPAPVLQLAPASKAAPTTSDSNTAAATTSSSDGLSRGLAIAALVVALLAAALATRAVTRRR
jgi:uncharacterized protein YcnI